jgi:hypothetical protein
VKKSIGKNKKFLEIQKKQKCNRNNMAYTKEKMEIFNKLEILERMEKFLKNIHTNCMYISPSKNCLEHVLHIPY